MKKSLREEFDGLDGRYNESRFKKKKKPANFKYRGLWKYLHYDFLPKNLGVEARLELIREKCKVGGEVDILLLEFYEHLQTLSDSSKRAVSNWQNYLSALGAAANYITGVDSEGNVISRSTEEQMDRYEYETDREYTTKLFTAICPKTWNGTQIDFINKKTRHSDVESDPQDSVLGKVEFVEGYEDFTDMERKIAKLLSVKIAKVNIQKQLKISDSHLRTRIRHMEKKVLLSRQKTPK